MIWYVGVQRLGSARTSVYSNLVPVAALITAALWLGEPIARAKLAGAALVIGGLAVTRIRLPRRSCPPEVAEHGRVSAQSRLRGAPDLWVLAFSPLVAASNSTSNTSQVFGRDVAVGRAAVGERRRNDHPPLAADLHPRHACSKPGMTAFVPRRKE